MIRARRALALPVLLAACGTTPQEAEEAARPDFAALRRKTTVRARSARIVLSDRWRGEARWEGAVVLHPEPGIDTAAGKAVFLLHGLRVETEESLKVTWLADHENFLLYATEVALFSQQRDQPYHTTDVSAVSMANDQVSFFQQQ